MSDANYTDDVREIAPIACYEETEEDLDDFVEDYYEHAEKPQSVPEDVDFEEIDDIEEVMEVDEEDARRRAERLFKFAYGYAEYADGVARANVSDSQGPLVVFKLPGWFADDELGEWEEWWFGNLQVAKEDPEDGWTAMCLADIEPVADRREDSYFRNPVEEEWVPVSLVEFAFAVVDERSDGHLIYDRGLDSDTIDRERGFADEADIIVQYIDHNAAYGPKAVLDSPYEAKDDIKGLDWEQYHPDWTGDAWTIDAGALWSAIEELTLQGWSVCVTERVEAAATDDPMADEVYLPEGGA